MMWAVDDGRTDVLSLGYAYFETPEPWDEDEPGTYVATDTEFVNNRAISWNHGLRETVTRCSRAVRGHRPRRAPERAVGRAPRADGRRRGPRRVVAHRARRTAAPLLHAAGPQALSNGSAHVEPVEERQASTATRSTVPRPTTVPRHPSPRR